MDRETRDAISRLLGRNAMEMLDDLVKAATVGGSKELEPPRENKCRPLGEMVHDMYDAFRDDGFSDEQAYELVKIIIGNVKI